MKYIGLLFCLLLSFNLAAQKSGFDFGIEVNTGVSDRFYTGEDNEAVNAQKKFLQDRKKPIFAFRVALNAEYFLSEKVSLSGGIGFSRSGIDFKESGGTNISEVLTSGGNEINDLFLTEILSVTPTLDKQINYRLEIPFLLNYYLQENQDGFFLSGGVSPLYNLKTANSAVKADDNYRRMNLNAEIGFGYRKSLNEKLSLSIVPNFQMQILEQSKNDGGLNRRLYFAGIAVRVR